MTKATARERLEAATARIADPSGEGTRTCLTVYGRSATAAADAADARARDGISLGALDGAIVSIKDLFDVAGEPTRAGAKILSNAPPATADAVVVQRLRAAGAVIVAKTNMTEFAFSGVGYNPHFGTPGNPADRARVPGGSSSGAAVAAADGMCEIAIGTDTGGSTRIPAGVCGVVGFKPSKQRIPTTGAFPLSYTLDSIGPIATTVARCAAADAVMAGEANWELTPAALSGLRLGVLRSPHLHAVEEEVAKAFADGVDALRKAGAQAEEVAFDVLEQMVAVTPKGGFPVPEAYSIHRERLATRGEDFDPFVRARIANGAKIAAADYIDLVQARNRAVAAMDAWLEATGLDAVLLPTTPILAPRQDEVTTPETFVPKNVAMLANASIGNFFDLCGISVPLPRGNALPVGLMLLARNGSDRRLFRIAAAVERHFT